MAQNNSTLYLLSYNNYYNRIVKREENLSNYLNYVVYDPLVCNFNPADGIETEHYFNISYIADMPSVDYLLVVDEEQEIVSRWFIVNAERVRGGQYRFSLHRDLVADFYQEAVSAPTFVERAMASIQNPFIFNSEGMNFNQIKKREVLLKDETKSGWYVGYIAKDTPSTTVTIPTETNISYPAPSIDYDTLMSYSGSIARQPNYSVTARAPVAGVARYRELTVNTGGQVEVARDVAYSGSPVPYNSKRLFSAGRTPELDGSSFLSGVRSSLVLVNQGLNAELANSYNIYDDSIIDTLVGMNGGIFYDTGSSKIFKVSLTSSSTTTPEQTITAGAGAETLINICVERCSMAIGGGGSVIVHISYKATVTYYNLVVTDLTNTQGASATISPQTASLIDAPYKMFAIPAQAVAVSFKGSPQAIYTSNPNLSKNFACAIATALGGTAEVASRLYDLQYLPYCPVRGLYENGKIMLNGTKEEATNKSITFLAQGSNFLSFMLWATESNFSFNINEAITVPSQPLEFKVAHETKFCRLVSPNYSGAFEFKPTTNFGVDYFEVNCSYKPFQPYIHVNPHFSTRGLYGGDYNDERGLVCSGDFSLPIMTDAWVSYQLQNASYKDSFNRQIENMEVVYGIQRNQAQTAGRIGVFTAGISGATAGGMAGSLAGPWGAGIGALAGGFLGASGSAYGLQKDLEYAQMLQDEALSYAQDQFNYSLQNIKALPYSLGRVGALNINNKIFPFVEFYEATAEETEALIERLKYRGMTIGAISTISNYKQDTPTFIQGSVIRFDGLSDDYHMASALANEIHKGVYI